MSQCINYPLHGESVCPKMGTDFIPKGEIINKCAAYRPDISLMSHLEYNQFPFLDTRTRHALVHISGRALLKKKMIKYVQPKDHTNIYVIFRTYISF